MVDYIIVSTPTNYDPGSNFFDTSRIGAVIAQALELAARGPVTLRQPADRGGRGQPPGAALLASGAEAEHIPTLFIGAAEAEAIKLFSNAFLAMRVAYFNEFDSYVMAFGLDTRQTIHGVSLDPQIEAHYNNPSFGYGGYCLPKDTKQLLANYTRVPKHLIHAIVEANRTRKDFIPDRNLAHTSRVVGIHRLVLKAGSDNFRQSSVQGMTKRLNAKGVEILVYEPALEAERFLGSRVTHDLAAFKREADLIVANRMVPELEDVADRVFTRDLFQND